MITQDIQNDIDDILDWFDFERVAKVMECLNWEWGRSVGKEGDFEDALPYIPNVPELRKEARRLLRSTVEQALKSGEETYTVSTGGFDEIGRAHV